MIIDPDNADIASTPYQLIKQYVIRPGVYLVNGLYNRRLKTRFHAEINLCQTHPNRIVFRAKLRRVPTAWGNADVRINNQYGSKAPFPAPVITINGRDSAVIAFPIHDN